MSAPDPAAGQGVPEWRDVRELRNALAEGNWGDTPEGAIDAILVLLDAAPARSGAEPEDDTAAPLAWWSPSTRCVYTDRPSWPTSFAEDENDALPLAPAASAARPATLNSELTVPAAVPRTPVEALLAALSSSSALSTALAETRLRDAVAEVRRHLDATTNPPEEGN